MRCLRRADHSDVARPEERLQGSATLERAAFILAGQTVWLIVCCAVFRVVWRRGVRAYSAVGA